MSIKHLKYFLLKHKISPLIKLGELYAQNFQHTLIAFLLNTFLCIYDAVTDNIVVVCITLQY